MAQKNNKIDKNKIPVVILCGGKGTRLKEETEFIPKPLVKIGGKPILWHIMKIYSFYGFNNFILPVGYKGEKIKEYFYNYPVLQNNFTIRLGSPAGEIFFHNPLRDDWQVSVIDTGLEAMTGDRLKRVEKFISSEVFMLTYGDGVANVNLDNLLKFHLKNKKLATVTAVRPPARFGEITVKSKNALSFREKPQTMNGYINGGFFVFNKKALNLLDGKEPLSLEADVLPELARKKELGVFCHNDYWHCMDMLRDAEVLNKEWESGKAGWKIWTS